ncbi:MAG: hypothetical protein MJE77_06510 [Proteobacteria bacterium]|nr:hypothetical protein [Pseudomonadota bacterium]
MSTKIPGTIEVVTSDGERFFVQVDESAEPEPQVRRGAARSTTPPIRGLERAEKAADRVLQSELFARAAVVIKEVSQDVTSGLLETNPRPSEVQLSLDLGFDAGGNVWIFKGGARASMRLTLKWDLPPTGE